MECEDIRFVDGSSRQPDRLRPVGLDCTQGKDDLSEPGLPGGRKSYSRVTSVLQPRGLAYFQSYSGYSGGGIPDLLSQLIFRVSYCWRASRSKEFSSAISSLLFGRSAHTVS